MSNTTLPSGYMQLTLSSKQREVLEAVGRLKVASELELQSITFMPDDELKTIIEELEKGHLVKREFGLLSKANQGDGIKITDEGFKQL